MKTGTRSILHSLVILTFLSTLWAGDPATNANPPRHIVYWHVPDLNLMEAEAGRHGMDRLPERES